MLQEYIHTIIFVDVNRGRRASKKMQTQIYIMYLCVSAVIFDAPDLTP